MALLKRKSRMVNFRLSEAEYEYLKKLCQSEGARSVSDFARAAVCRSMTAARPGKEQVEVLVHILDEKVGELDQRVKELADRIETAQLPRSGTRNESEESG